MSLQDACTGPETMVPSAVRGYRSWGLEQVSGDGRLHLASTGVPYLWRPGPLVARCARHDRRWQASMFTGLLGCRCSLCQRYSGAPDRPPPDLEHRAPVADCQCGFYAWYRPGDIRIVPAAVTGVIEASGRVMAGPHGFRAERVRLLAVTMPGDYTRDPALCDLALRLQRDGVQVFDNQLALVEAFPPDDVSTLTGHSCTDACQDLASTRFVSVAVPQAVVAAMTKRAQQQFADAAKAMDAMLATWQAANPALRPAAPPTPPPPPTAEAQRTRALALRRCRGTGPQHAKRWWQR